MTDEHRQRRALRLAHMAGSIFFGLVVRGAAAAAMVGLARAVWILVEGVADKVGK